MPLYRLIIQGEGVKPGGEWFGFYATRDHEASSEAEASQLATDALIADWSSGETAELGELRLSRVAACWIPRAGHSPMERGHTFYNDDVEAQRSAWRLETEAANAPPAIRKIHID